MHPYNTIMWCMCCAGAGFYWHCRWQSAENSGRFNVSLEMPGRYRFVFFSLFLHSIRDVLFSLAVTGRQSFFSSLWKKILRKSQMLGITWRKWQMARVLQK